MAVQPRAVRKANERLRIVMEEAGSSNTGLARRVNACGAERGLDLRYDKTSVARWLQGQQPRGRVPTVIAEALGRKLGRTVTVDEIGMNPAPVSGPTAGLRFELTVPDALQQACALWHDDARHIGLSATEKLAPSVLVQSSRDWLIADPDPAATGDGDFTVDPADAGAVRATAAAFADLDHRFGSSHIRPATVGYLNSTVAELLRGSYHEATGKQVLGAAARLTELAGYMAVDIDQLGLAQRYYIQALRLAQATDDRDFGGYVLASGMSHVALLLDNPREAIQLARVAREGLRKGNTTRVRVICHATEARGYALLGDEYACEKAIEQASEALKCSCHEESPDWAAHVDRAYLAEQLARCYADLNQFTKAAQCAQEALQGCPPDRARRRALRLLLLASVQLHQGQGETDQSRGTAIQAIKVLRRLRSAQCNNALNSFCERLKALGERDGTWELLCTERQD
ncbi:transcriptional regulator [Streptomyces sp. NPDC005876]|uniref:transcriptional regulator n=1 Tax=Streptomyces sp. NPDC005876 TaxID=3157076 RepID=UPI00340C5B30